MNPRARRRVGTEHTLIITSMVDMFTLLLTFLLNFVNPSDGSSDAVLLPPSSASKPAESGITLTVGAGAVRVGEEVVLALVGEGPEARLDPAAKGGDGAGLVALVQALDRARGPVAPGDEGVLLVRCDRSVPYALLAEVLTAAAGAGFDRYRLVVVGENE